MSFAPSPYIPRFRNPHLQTLYAWATPRNTARLPTAEARYFDVSADARVLAHCNWQRNRDRHPTLLLLHGLEGSSAAHYMRGISEKAWAAGWNVVRLNQRNCGNTEHLSRGLYHSGLTQDPLFVLRELIEADGIRTLAVAGYSLGGNLTLKLAGELGDTPPPELVAVCAVSPTMELAVCVDALERRSNFAYQWNFVRNLKARMRRKALAFPDAFVLDALRQVRSVRQFDEAYTAPHHDFRDAADYYHRASAMRVIGRIRVPALILTAADDPFVPLAPFQDPAITGNPALTVVVTPHGGHCAFLEPKGGEYDGYWAEREIVRFVSAWAAASHQPTRDATSTTARTQAPSLALRV